MKGTKALEVWCARQTQGYPGVNVCNMTTAWRDGLAFCALIHRFRPDIVEFDKLDKKNIKGNCSLAFCLAETHFGIPQLLDADDMVNCSLPDRLSILTYVSECYHKMKHLQPRGNPLLLSMIRRCEERRDSSDISSSGMSSMSSSSSSPSPPPEEKVIRRGRRSRSQASARLVQSMYASSGGIGSLFLSSEDSSPDIERENPFRDNVMKACGEMKEEVKKKKKSLMERHHSADPSPLFQSVLQSQVSDFPRKSRKTSRSTMNCAQLSFTSTPRPYNSGQINRSVSLGHALNQTSSWMTQSLNESDSLSRRPLIWRPSPSWMTVEKRQHTRNTLV